MTGPGIVMLGIGFLGAYFEAYGVRLVGGIAAALCFCLSLSAAHQALGEGDWYHMISYPAQATASIFAGFLLGGFMSFLTGPFVTWRDESHMRMVAFVVGIAGWIGFEVTIGDSVHHFVCGTLSFLDVGCPACFTPAP